jgi:tetratricopeptide (TPR) repeat protein
MTWRIVELEPAAAGRSGLPERLAVPEDVAQAGGPLEREQAARWAPGFTTEHPEHPLAQTMAQLATAEPFRRLGLELAEEGRLGDAARALDRAAELAPFDAGTRVARARVLEQEGDLEGALGDLESAAWAYETDPGFALERAHVLEALGEQDRAVAEYERALAQAPGLAAAIDRLEALGALVRLDIPGGEAVYLSPPDFERVIRTDLAENVDDAGALALRGAALAADGHLDLARTAAELALRADESNPDAQQLAAALGVG